jgi:CHAT domain-containing protein
MTGGRIAPCLATILVAGLVWGIVSASPARSQNGDELATVFQQSVQLYQAGKYIEAVPFSERYVKLTQERVGPDHADYATALHGLGTVYHLSGRNGDAETVVAQSLAIREKLGGPHHPIVADSLNLLANIERALGQRGEAEALSRRALAIREASLGHEHLLVAAALATLTVVCDRPQCAIEKESLLKRVIAIREKALGSRDRLSLISHFALASFYWSNGRLLEAESHFIHGISEWEQLFGAEHSELGPYLYGLAEVTRALGRLEEAERLHLRALAIYETIQPPEKTGIVGSLSALAFMRYSQHRYAEAVQNYQRILLIKANDLDKSWAEKGLADSYYALGQYSSAEHLYKRVLESIEQTEGTDHLRVADVLNELANLYEAQGRYLDVEPLHKRALAIKELKLGPDDKSVAVTLHNLAGLYQYLGRYQEAQQLEKRALDIKEKTIGPDHPGVAQSLTVLAEIYGNLGRYEDAEPLVHRAIEIYKNAPGDHRASLAGSLLSLSLLRRFQRKGVEAEALLRQVIEIETAALGSDHPNLASSYNALANLLDEHERGEEATAYREAALRIGESSLGPDHPETLWSRVSLALHAAETNLELNIEPLIQEAKKRAEGRLGATHPALISASIKIGRTYLARHNWLAAYEYLKLASEIAQHKARSLNEGSTISADKLAWNEFEVPYASAVKAAFRIEGTAQIAGISDDVFKLSQLAAQTDASGALGQMAARFASGSSPLAALIRERQDLISQRRVVERRLFLGKAERLDEADVAANSAFLTIEMRLRVIDDRLKQEFPEYAALANPQPLTISETQAQLHSHEVLVQFLEAPKVANLPSEMFVWVVTKDQSRWASATLDVSSLNELVRALRCGLDRTQWALPTAEGLPSCQQLFGLDSPPAENEALPFDLGRSHTLYRALLEPFEELIKDKHLLIVPSGSLTSLPFQVLITDTPGDAAPAKEVYREAKWLISRQPITILPSISSLKSLRKSAKASQASRAYLGIGNPLLDGDGKTRIEIDRANAARQFQRCPEAVHSIPVASSPHARPAVSPLVRGGLANLKEIRSQLPLPETTDEICAVAANFGASSDDVRLGDHATETEIKDLNASGRLATYRILHFATHAAVSGGVEGNAEPGLILTPPPTATEVDDAYLTASEVASLKLDADWVILSACNTASGGTANAETLSGLARAFFYAGARSLLVSHWSVESEPTVELITKAFAALRADPGIGRAEALRRSMTMLIATGGSRAHPATWAPFVVVGEGGTEAALTSAATTVTNMKKVPTATKIQKPARRPQEDWRVEVLR